MRKHRPENELAKRRYLQFLKEAKRQSEATIAATAKAIARFESQTNYRDFRSFRAEQAISFKRHLEKTQNKRTGKPLSKSTVHGTLSDLRRFFEWLAQQPGYKSRIQYLDAEYFNASRNDQRIATARREKAFPTLEQIKHTISTMPTDTEVERRDRAVLAFAILTGARDRAIASAALKHVDVIERVFRQDAREVRTKFAKTFTTAFFPVGDELVEIVSDWVRELRDVKLWGNDDPLFPRTAVARDGQGAFGVVGLERECWRDAGPIRRIFKEAFTRAGLPYYNPHSFRDTLVHLGEKRCRTIEEFKAWSQNLGHERVQTTLESYGYVPEARQCEIVGGLGENAAGVGSVEERVERALKKFLDERES